MYSDQLRSRCTCDITCMEKTQNKNLTKHTRKQFGLNIDYPFPLPTTFRFERFMIVVY